MTGFVELKHSKPKENLEVSVRAPHLGINNARCIFEYVILHKRDDPFRLSVIITMRGVSGDLPDGCSIQVLPDIIEGIAWSAEYD